MLAPCGNHIKRPMFRHLEKLKQEKNRKLTNSVMGHYFFFIMYDFKLFIIIPNNCMNVAYSCHSLCQDPLPNNPLPNCSFYQHNKPCSLISPRIGIWDRGAAAHPQIVGQTRPVRQYSLHSRAILAYYKNK